MTHNLKKISIHVRVYSKFRILSIYTDLLFVYFYTIWPWCSCTCQGHIKVKAKVFSVSTFMFFCFYVYNIWLWQLDIFCSCTFIITIWLIDFFDLYHILNIKVCFVVWLITNKIESLTHCITCPWKRPCTISIIGEYEGTLFKNTKAVVNITICWFFPANNAVVIKAMTTTRLPQPYLWQRILKVIFACKINNNIFI